MSFVTILKRQHYQYHVCACKKKEKEKESLNEQDISWRRNLVHVTRAGWLEISGPDVTVDISQGDWSVIVDEAWGTSLAAIAPTCSHFTFLLPSGVGTLMTLDGGR